MLETAPPESRFLVPFEGAFDLASSPTEPPPDAVPTPDDKERLRSVIHDIAGLQKRLYAQHRYSLLLVFQAMDAAGKDSTIRAVTTGVNPAGFQVFSFKVPSKEELDHDFLWRSAIRLPERGRIGIFNRSYYEEVLVVRVHPEFLGGQGLPTLPDLESLWTGRYESIRDHELHLARSGTVLLKFWLNVSREQQARRLLRRLDRPGKQWKFHSGDLAEREHWDAYMAAYEDALGATSRPWAPWYAIPADDKPFMRLEVARIIRAQLEALDLRFPELPQSERDKLTEYREALERDL